MDRDQFRQFIFPDIETEYEYIHIKLNDSDVGKFEFFQNGEKQFVNMLGHSEIIIKRRKWQ